MNEITMIDYCYEVSYSLEQKMSTGDRPMLYASLGLFAVVGLESVR